MALVFVLARNLLKLWVERRQAAPFARFRAKLVGALLAMSIIPAVLVLISGSEILRNSAARWFSEPVEQVVTGAKRHRRSGSIRSSRTRWRCEPSGWRGRCRSSAVAGADEPALAGPLKEELLTMRDSMIELYRADARAGGRDRCGVRHGGGVVRAAARSRPCVGRPSGARGRSRPAHDQTPIEEPVESGGVLLRAASPILDADRTIVGAVVVSRHIGADLDRDARRASAAFERYKGLEVLQGPILGSYLSIFLTVTLLILIAATWLGLYLAKRITRPVQQLAEGARAIGAGNLDVRLEAETGDELGSLVEAFNMMAAELQTNRAKLDQSRQDLERKNAEVDARRRYIETVLERVATGVISLDADGRISTMNGAAAAAARGGRDLPGAAGARRAGARRSAAAPAADRGRRAARGARHRSGSHAGARGARDQPRHGRHGPGRR